MNKAATHLTIALAIVAVLSPVARPGTVYDESILGDLSNFGLTPTFLSFAPGSNRVLGTTGRGAAGIDRDYFSFVVPVGFQISQFIELAGTNVGGAVSFLGLQAGPQFTVATSATTAAGLLGWDHYGPVAVNTDIFASLATPSLGSSGFSVLSAGSYSVWIQDFNAGTFNYGFDVLLTPTPEPGTYATGLGGFALLGFMALRRRRPAR